MSLVRPSFPIPVEFERPLKRDYGICEVDSNFN